MTGFKNINVCTQDNGIIRTSIAIENGKIAEMGDNLQIEDTFDIPADAIVCAGFIDEHVHGSNGSDVMDGNLTAIKTVAESLAKEGTTAFLATTMTQSKNKINNALCAVNEYIGRHFDSGAEVLGVHLEGPFISPKYAGAQDKKYIISPNEYDFKEFEKSSGNNIKMVTLAVEECSDNVLIDYLSNKNIVVSIGHSNAKFVDIKRAFENGVSCVTHTFNAQSPLHHREVGVVGGAMLIDGLKTELICDLMHVESNAVKLLVKNKRENRVILITDAIRAKGMGNGIFELGGQTVYVENGKATLQNGTLAGSTLKMNTAIKNMVETCDLPLYKAVNMATINVAKNLGIDSKMGSITKGKLANFAVLDKNFNVIMTIRNGKIVYKNNR